MPPLSETDFLLRLVAALVLGAALGLERSLSGKQAGMRTYALVSLGSALFTGVGVISALQLSVFGGSDPLRIASSVVVGIGFIGAGLAAFRSGDHVELTTAAGIWVAAGIGLAAGLGLYTAAAGAAALAILVFSILSKVESSLQKYWGNDKE